MRTFPVVTFPAPLARLVSLPSLDRRIWVLTLVRFIVTAGYAVVMPFLALHLAVERHVPVLRIGALWAASSAASAAAQWLAGHFADRWGRRPVLLAGLIVRSINLAALGYAVGAHAPFGVIAALAIGNGALRGLYDPVAWAMVSSLARQEDRVAAFALHRVGSSLGWVAGSLVATLAADTSYSTLFYACAPLTLLAAVAAAFIPETRTRSLSRPPGMFDLLAFVQDPAFVRFLFGSLFFFLLQTQMYHLLAIYAGKELGLNRGQVGSLFTVNAVLVVALQLFAVRFIRRFGSAKVLVFGSLGYLVAFVGCGAAVDYLSLLACVALMTLCEIATAPAQQERVTQLAPADRVAAYGGAFGLFQGAAQSIGPVLGVFLLEALSPRAAWFAMAGFGLFAAWLYRERRPITSDTLGPPRAIPADR